MQITDQGSPNVFVNEREERGDEGARGQGSASPDPRVCKRAALLFFFLLKCSTSGISRGGGNCAGLGGEILPKRGLHMCNSFWRP